MLAGHKMQLIRIQHNLSQQELADAIGCSTKVIGNYENERANISEELYLKWINALYQTEPQNKKGGRPKKKKDEDTQDGGQI